MESLIKVENGIAALDETTALLIADFEIKIKQIKDREEILKNAILAEMEDKGIIKIDNDFLTITYVAASDRETLDTKMLRADLPEIFDDYVKITPVKASVRIKVKDYGKVEN